MKMILLTIVCVVPTMCYGQVRGTAANSVEAQSRIFEQKREAGRAKIKARQRAKAKETKIQKNIRFGQALFGEDNRIHLFPVLKAFHLGGWGQSRAIFRVMSKIDNNECLLRVVEPSELEGSILLLRGLSTEKVTDDVQFILRHPFVIDKTYSYTTVAGSKKTILVLDCNAEKLDVLLKKHSEDKRAAWQAEENKLFRIWTDSTGKFSVEAKFLRYKNNQVMFMQRSDRKLLTLPMRRLSAEDQRWIQSTLRNNAKGAKP